MFKLRSKRKVSKVQAAAITGVGEHTIGRAIRDGELNASREGGRVWISSDDLQRFIVARQERRGRRRSVLVKTVDDYTRRIIALECGREAGA